MNISKALKSGLLLIFAYFLINIEYNTSRLAEKKVCIQNDQPEVSRKTGF